MPSASARLALTLALLAFTAPAMAEVAEAPIDWKKGGQWSALTEYIGTYETEKVFTDKKVKEELDKMLNGQKVDLNAQFAVHGPIGFDNDCLIIRGNQEGKGDTNRAYAEVCVAQGTINLALYDSGKITVFTKFTDYQYLSEGMKRWIYLQSIPVTDLEKKPDDLQIFTQAE